LAGEIISLIRTVPAAHSPPNPKPCSALKIISWLKVCAKALAKQATANQTMVICNVLTRPILSPSAPNSQPPSADVASTTPATAPASARVAWKVARMEASASPYICKSSASSAQP